jgi:hypothetical protein
MAYGTLAMPPVVLGEGLSVASEAIVADFKVAREALSLWAVRQLLIPGPRQVLLVAVATEATMVGAEAEATMVAEGRNTMLEVAVQAIPRASY